MQTSSIALACNGVHAVMIVVEFIENHPPLDDEYRLDGPRSLAPRPARCGSYAEALGPQSFPSSEARFLPRNLASLIICHRFVIRIGRHGGAR
jgi:hypothetical protein